MNTSQLSFYAQPTPTRYNTAPLPRKPGNRWLLGAGMAVGAVVLAAIGGHGTAIPPDQEIAWLSQLAANGDAGAQLQLGLAYREGRYGLKADEKTGSYWLAQAAHNGQSYPAGQGTAPALPTAQHPNQLHAMAARIGSPTLETLADLWDVAVLSARAPQTDRLP
ncbi:MAG: sel1 repeat family protein [Gammaproteobacteria bacterium]|nr:sel1 repeat family protein [Gammaproteobacteria bacterium]